MSKINNVTKEQLNEFYQEVDNQKSEIHLNNNKQHPALNKYQCPKCHKPLASRKEPCKHCGYSGYIPMSESEIKKIRTILFIIILVIAITVLIIR